MKKIMAVVTAVLFVSALMITNMAFAEGAMDKAATPMADNASEGAKVSKDAKDKAKGHEAKMHKKEKKKKNKKSKKKKKKKS